MMQKFKYPVVLLALLLSAVSAFAEAPVGYYSGITGLKDKDLKNKLYQIISNHSTNDYSGLFRQSFIYTDLRANGSWWDMYSDIVRYARQGNYISWSGMNREHSFPKSWWGGDQNPAYTDLNHLYPSDGDANMAKSNYPLGEVVSASYDNGVVKVGSPKAGQGGGSGMVFEPADEYKGDFARTYFYMVTCYQNLTWVSKYSYMLQNNTYPTLKPWAVDLLLRWHRDDPVSDKETARNDEVYHLQHNRNPFIDYPELAEYIWGAEKGQPFEEGDIPPIGDGTLISPVNNTAYDFGDVVVGQEKTITINIRGSLSTNLSATISGTDRDKFSIPTDNIPLREVNSDAGYNLQVTVAPTESNASLSAKLLLYDGGLQGITSYTIPLTATSVDVPVFDRPEAIDATNISSTGFTARWKRPANPAVIDSYQVTVIETVGDDNHSYTQTTDGDDTQLEFTDLKSWASYSYFVQSVRLDMLSERSNVIFVKSFGGVSETDVAAAGFTAYAVDGGIRISCSVAQRNLRVVDMAGRTVAVLPEAEDGTVIALPRGIYLLGSAAMPRPQKIVASR